MRLCNCTLFALSKSLRWKDIKRFPSGEGGSLMTRYFYFLVLLVLFLYCCVGASASDSERVNGAAGNSSGNYKQYCYARVVSHLRRLNGRGYSVAGSGVVQNKTDLRKVQIDGEYLEDIHCVIAGLIQIGLDDPASKTLCFSHASSICAYERMLLGSGIGYGAGLAAGSGLRVSREELRRARVLLGCFNSVIESEGLAQPYRPSGVFESATPTTFFACEYRTLVTSGLIKVPTDGGGSSVVTPRLAQVNRPH